MDYHEYQIKRIILV